MRRRPALFVCDFVGADKMVSLLAVLDCGNLALESHRLLGIINVQKMHIVLLTQLALGKDVPFIAVPPSGRLFLFGEVDVDHVAVFRLMAEALSWLSRKSR